MSLALRAGAALAAAALAAAAAWWFWPAPAPVPVVADAPATTTARGDLAPPPAPSAPASAPQPEEPPPAASPLAAGEVAAALGSLLGRDAVLRWLVTDDFARRAAATVDNLGRAHASAALWPVQRTGGRFSAATQGGVEVIGPANAQRYVAFVSLLESVDANDAVAFYARLQPLLQASYEELGYPGQRFHARLVAVIDLLLATPQPAGAVALHLVDVKGSVPSTRPWVRYEFADPALEALPAGQKILLRVGPDNARRLKVWLQDFRRAMIDQPGGAAAPR